MRRAMRRITASSSSKGRFVAPMMSTRSSLRLTPHPFTDPLVAAPSSWIMNSVFSRRLASFSLSLDVSRTPHTHLRAVRIESISSMKMMDGWLRYATLALTDHFEYHLNSAFTIFSLSPTHLLVSDDDEMLKKNAEDSVATAYASLSSSVRTFASMVLPVPGGPKSRMPFGGARRPVNKSGRLEGRITV